MVPTPSVRVTCSQCGTSRIDPLPTILRRLGMLKRNRELDVETMWQLLQAAQSRLACDECGWVGLRCEQMSDEGEEGEEDDWPSVPVCRVCRKPIAVERLRLFPDAKYCATCQQSLDRQGDVRDREFCPRCGAVLQVRSSRRSGLSRYEMTCPSCSYRV